MKQRTFILCFIFLGLAISLLHGKWDIFGYFENRFYLIDNPEKSWSNPDEKFNRGEPLRWILHRDPDATGEPVSAHFQFMEDDKDLFDLKANEKELTGDLTAKIPANETELSLKLSREADRRRNPRFYAVFISDAQHENGGVFAVGEDENPPPEIDIGGP